MKGAVVSLFGVGVFLLLLTVQGQGQQRRVLCTREGRVRVDHEKHWDEPCLNLSNFAPNATRCDYVYCSWSPQYRIFLKFGFSCPGNRGSTPSGTTPDYYYDETLQLCYPYQTTTPYYFGK